MKHIGKIALGITIGLMAHRSSAAVSGNSTNHPYLPIVKQNVFRLKSPSETAVAPPKPARPRIQLQGIVSAFGKKEVFLKITPAAGTRATEHTSCILSEGMSRGEIKVLEINTHEKTVRFNNHGTEQVLSLKKDSVSASSRDTDLLTDAERALLVELDRILSK